MIVRNQKYTINKVNKIMIFFLASCGWLLVKLPGWVIVRVVVIQIDLLVFAA